MQLLLSSKTFRVTIGAVLGIGKFFDWSYYSKFLTAVNSQSAAESAIYSASGILISIRGYVLDYRIIEKPANMMTFLLLECDERGSFLGISCHDPAQSASK